MKTKQVWYNVETGTFSNSWLKEDHDMSIENQADKSKWKLIEYIVPNDEDFELCFGMQVK